MEYSRAVAVFWDYENCHPSSQSVGYEVVEQIRRIARPFGSVKLMKAYVELTQQTSPKSPNLRAELQSSGVSLTDCPHNGRKDVADKMILVDMFEFAIDTPPPATVILISGDRDFAYALSKLRLRTYTVVLIAPSHLHPSLKAQADVVFDWGKEVLGKPAPAVVASKCEAVGTTDKNTMEDKGVSELSGVRSASFPASPSHPKTLPDTNASRTQQRVRTPSTGLGFVQYHREGWGNEPAFERLRTAAPGFEPVERDDPWSPRDRAMIGGVADPLASNAQDGTADMCSPHVRHPSEPTPISGREYSGPTAHSASSNSPEDGRPHDYANRCTQHSPVVRSLTADSDDGDIVAGPRATPSNPPSALRLAALTATLLRSSNRRSLGVPNPDLAMRNSSTINFSKPHAQCDSDQQRGNQ